MFPPSCNLCPRGCGIDRNAGEKGFCGESAQLHAARAALHMWEEPCISGKEGSGTVFFSGCTLRCVYCQNRAISTGHSGKYISVSRLSDIFLELQQQGANNINLVTPDHFIPAIIPALKDAKAHGLHLPIVYNSSSYVRVETLRMLEGLIDIYLPDLKYISSELSSRYSAAPDYFTHASAAITEMVRQVGDAQFDDGDMMTRGVIVRHLLLPSCLEDSKAVVRWLWETFGDHIFLSLMSQYTPLPQLEGYPELQRKITPEEYNALTDYALSLGVTQGFIQDGEAADESFIPPFDHQGI